MREPQWKRPVSKIDRRPRPPNPTLPFPYLLPTTTPCTSTPVRTDLRAGGPPAQAARPLQPEGEAARLPQGPPLLRLPRHGQDHAGQGHCQGCVRALGLCPSARSRSTIRVTTSQFTDPNIPPSSTHKNRVGRRLHQPAHVHAHEQVLRGVKQARRRRLLAGLQGSTRAHTHPMSFTSHDPTDFNLTTPHHTTYIT